MQALDVASIERIVKDRKGKDWHVDWPRFLNAKSAYSSVGNVQGSTVHVPVYRYKYEGVSHE